MEDESAKEDLEALEDVDEKGEADNVGETGEAGEEGEETDTPTGEKKSLDLILDIPLTVTVELGRNKMLINDLLQLGQGSVIELKKLVGEPLEVLVNQKLVARGETVVVNEKFGVRLTDIVSPMERVKSLT
jgi:flagellar motor switch protein FliN/FliY|tara:strand:- start:1346 stop:1738 length:393 start_codon:yes stop_codon:yes gene_type:complete